MLIQVQISPTKSGVVALSMKNVVSESEALSPSSVDVALQVRLNSSGSV